MAILASDNEKDDGAANEVDEDDDEDDDVNADDGGIKDEPPPCAAVITAIMAAAAAAGDGGKVRTEPVGDNGAGKGEDGDGMTVRVLDTDRAEGLRGAAIIILSGGGICAD